MDSARQVADKVTRLLDVNSGEGPVQRDQVCWLLEEAASRLRQEDNVLNLHVNSVDFVICGDTHGQVFDVLEIFRLFGEVNKDGGKQFLFNGDFVDRGIYGVELALLLFALKLAHPENIYLVRGNHESRAMTSRYGFRNEVLFKYDLEIYNLFMQCFDALPLAATVKYFDRTFFVVHGGLFEDESVTLSTIHSLDRFREPPMSGPFHDLLWSDPQEGDGRAFNHQRGGGLRFGPDVTCTFLDMNKIDIVIRSHQVRDQGFSVEHGGKLLTVFSAPNYCDSMGNLGAVICLPALQQEVKFVQFEASKHPGMEWVKALYRKARL